MSFFFSSILIITALSLSLSLFLPPRRATRSNQLTALSLASPVARLVLGYIAMCCAQQLRGQTKNKQLKTKQKQTTSIRTNTDPLRYFSVYLVAETCKKKKADTTRAAASSGHLPPPRRRAGTVVKRSRR